MADGGAISVPAMMAIGGAMAGGAMDEENPLRGAALGAAGGYMGGAALGAGGAAAGSGAAGMGGAAGSGISGGLAGSAGAAGSGAGMSAMGGLGSGISGGGLGAAGTGGGMAALGAEGAGIAGSISPQLASAGAMGAGAGGLLGNPMAEKMASMGGQMMMNQERQKQGMPVAPVAPPMMRPQFQPSPFMASAPSFRGVTGMPIGRLPMGRGRY